MLDLTEAQVSLEDLGTATARTRALAHLSASVEAGEAAAAAPVKAMLRDALPATSDRISVALAEAPAEDTQKNPRDALELLQGQDPDVLAYIVLNGLFTAALAEGSLVACLQSIGTGAALERWVELTKVADPEKLKRLVKGKGGPLRIRTLPRDAKQLARLLHRHGTDDPKDWDAAMLVTAGSLLLGPAWETGLFELVETTGETSVVTLTEHGHAALEAYDVALPWQRPRLMPMVVQPSGWESPDRAPYLTEAQRRYLHVLGRARGRSKSVLKRAWDKPPIRPFRKALDTLSAVPFRVDMETVEAAQWCFRQGVRVTNIPATNRACYEAPENLEEMPEEAQKAEAAKKREVTAINQLNRTLGRELEKDVDTLRLIGNYSRIYQPHFADYRGRLYTASSLSHHRSDHVRAAFRFASGVPLGASGETWLSRHFANTASGDIHGKLDKMSWADREAWALANRGLALEVADNWQEKPYLWTGTDAPFAFLQACREFAAMLRWPGDKSSFPSSLIVGLDGTCSGLQHYAAALRAEGEGALVNLLPAQRPEDVYAAVSERVVGILRGLSEGDDAESSSARQWLDFGVNRGTVKRQVMTFAYSSEVFGFRDQITNDIMRPLKRRVLEGSLGQHPFVDDDGAWRASLVLARAIWRALQDVVVKAAEGMSWLKSTAGLLAKHGLGMEWTSPSGFPVVHMAMQGRLKRVGFTLGGKARVTVEVETLEGKSLVAHRQRNAASPNFIHSLDAAHLHLTTCAMADRGVTDLAMIHDSFGTQAGNTQLLSETLRETLVTMYETCDPFADLHAWALQALPEKARAELAPPPTKGGLDIRRVLDSPYVFC